MKYLLVFLLAAMITSTATAQLNLGVKGGLNVVNMAFGPPAFIPTQSQYRLSYHVGIYGQSDISDRFSIRPELLFSNKGFRSSDALGKSNVNLYYLSLPILAQYRIWDQLSVVLGPEVSYLLSAKARSAGGKSDVGFIYDRKIDLGIAAGLGYHVSEKVEIGVRYIYGLLDVIGDFTLTDEQGNLIDSNSKSQNRVFQFSVGYRLK